MPGKPPERLPSDLPRTKVINAFGRLGIHLLREGKEHSVYGDPTDPARSAALPRHSRINRVTLRRILRGLGVTEEQFMAYY
mgnify:CR=1 FL=1|jgi:hypothetical protein